MCSDDERAAFDDLCGGTTAVSSLDATARVPPVLLVDTLRLYRPEPGIFTWWDYRMLSFPKNRGLRIDAVLASKSLAAKCTNAGVDREMRKGKEPSDHAPIWAEFDS